MLTSRLAYKHTSWLHHSILLRVIRDCYVPIEGVSFILGNDLAGGKVLVNPEVTAVLSSG